MFVLAKVLFATAILTNALRSYVKIATTSLEVKTRIKRSCKILIDFVDTFPRYFNFEIR